MKLVGLNKWGKERVKRHGPEFELLRRAPFRGQPSVYVRGLKPAYKDGSPWIGWFQLGIDADVVD